jgi:DNA-3-methyladenine glycosylase II
MWFGQTADDHRWAGAQQHLAAASPRLARIIQRVGPCTLRPRRDYFVVLCKAIYTQQISTKVAAVLFARFREQFPRGRPTPQLVLKIIDDEARMRTCGLSRQKRGYIRDLAEHFASGAIKTRRLAAMTDEQVIEALTEVKGIGRWTAEMFLIFTLNRPDVLPVDDLGLRKAAQTVFKLRELPDALALRTLATPWEPWRSIATWYLWRGTA